MRLTTYHKLESVVEDRGAGFIVLIDPDKTPEVALPALAEAGAAAGVDAFFVGGSLVCASELDRYVARLKQASALPVIGFPGSLNQLAPSLDAVLFLSVISGRNPEYLFGQHVHAAPLIRHMGIEPISTGYMLVESGRLTAAQYMSHTMPLPRNKPDIAAATALAAEMLGMRLLFADAGSGAQHTVPEELIAAIDAISHIPLLVGGGIRTPDDAARKVQAGASFIVVGNAIEQDASGRYIADLARAVHEAGASRKRHRTGAGRASRVSPAEPFREGGYAR